MQTGNMKVSEEFKVGKNSIGYLWGEFETRFNGQDFTIPPVSPRAIKLPRSMNDAAIEGELKPGFCTMGDVMAVMKSDKKEYKDGNWNLFYFEACVVGVDWYGGEWRVGAWFRGGSEWREGGRVFSPATVPQTSVLSEPMTPEQKILSVTGVQYGASYVALATTESGVLMQGIFDLKKKKWGKWGIIKVG